VSQKPTTRVRVICPTCGFRGAAPEIALGHTVSCGKCGATFVARAERTAPEMLPQDFSLEASDLPPQSGVQTVYPTSDDDYQLAPPPPTVPPPRPAARLVPEDAPPDYLVVPPKGAALAWAFTKNVFLFPWTPSAVAQWIYSSLGLMAAGFFGLLAIMGFIGASQAGALMAGSLAMATFWAILLSGSYLSASLFDIIVNAAYNADKAHDWPHADWRERIWYLLRVGYLLALAGGISAGVAQLNSLAGGVFWPVLAAAIFLLFPILLLAMMESDSLFLPISWPIFLSLVRVWYGWAVFYVLSGLLFVGCAFVTVVVFNQSNLATPFVTGPIWAAAAFIYGRLLGRLAWLILQRADPTKQQRDRLRYH
jgi:hypothetical protein